jgi:LmbE family N-acetylglucosaminyl deacetylase
MSRVLVVAAHPDDEILGCGATILKRIDEGDEVYSLVLGEGITSRYDRREDADAGERRRLHEAHDRVARFMGFTRHWLHEFPDNRFDSVDLLDLVKTVERTKREVRPEVVYTHFQNDLNVDHRLTSAAVLTACRPLAGETVREILSFEIPSSTEWVSPVDGGGYFRPNVFVEVEATLERKIDAMRLYEGEVREYPHPRSPEALRVIAQRWGVASGRRAAEAFMLVRRIA